MKNSTIVAWFALLIAIIIVVVVWHANASNNANATSASTAVTTSTGSTSAVHTLDGTTFRFTSYDNTVIPANENYLMEFSGGLLHGGICENFSGPYTASDGMISAKLASSTTGCTLPTDINAADQLFHTTLAQAPKYTYVGDVLTISGSGHTLVFNAFLK
jgi:heat shock protein HslJ